MLRSRIFIVFIVVVISLLGVPSDAEAFQTSALLPLVQCGRTNETGMIDNSCDFDDFILLVQRVMNYLIIIAVPLSAMIFAWAGFILLTAGGNEDKVKDAWKIFRQVVVGFILMLSAWLLVHAIAAALLKREFRDVLIDGFRGTFI